MPLTSSRRLQLVCLVAAACVLGTITWQVVSGVRERSSWRASLPQLPKLGKWPRQFAERIQKVDSSARGWPPDDAALGELARLYVANGFPKPAEVVLHMLMSHQPEDPRWPYYLAGILADGGRLEEAIPYLVEVASIKPDYVPARLKLAEGLRKLNRSEQAVKVYAEVLSKEPQNNEALAGLAVIDIEAGRWSEAKARLLSIVTRDSSFWTAFSLLATVADHLGESELAERARKRANEIGRFKEITDPWTDELLPYCYDVYRLQVIASAKSTTGDQAAAIAALRHAAELAPDDARTRRHLGKVYLASNDIVHAREELERAVALDPAEPTSYVELEKVYKAGNDVAGAERLLAEGLKHAPNSPALHYEYALVLVAEGRVAEGVPHMERARDLAPENVGTYEKLAMGYFRLGRSDDAVQAIETGLKRDPNNGPLIFLKGRYAIQTGDASLAEECLEQVRKLGAPAANVEEFSEFFRRRFGRRPQ